MLDDAQIRQFEFLDPLEQRTHARRVNLDANVITLGAYLCNSCGAFPHSEADLQKSRRTPSKNAVEIKQVLLKSYAVLRHQQHCPLLGIRNAPLAKHKTAYGMMPGH